MQQNPTSDVTENETNKKSSKSLLSSPSITIEISNQEITITTPMPSESTESNDNT
ncbi:hypothetical protein C8N46_1172 [Kordia periserrulae]|uniref:Uncharacterized protein n=1 Tax=Kordia periserrulae TaxID=701523 RepID=A0A2T6BQB1_9FLAO|nr:hypothetical protein [Kordia periserrulae]PTX58226.1 hypothetical protein C8N46_1172 [Kordia periserrulae]